MVKKMGLYSRTEEQQRNRHAAGRRRNARKKKERGGDALILLLVLLIGLFCVTMHVQGSEAKGSGYDEQAYDELEKIYYSEVHELLTDYGLHNSGMNLTKITRADGAREYRLEVHHKGIGHMTGTERESLQESLEIINFPDDRSTVCVRLSF